MLPIKYWTLELIYSYQVIIYINRLTYIIRKLTGMTTSGHIEITDHWDVIIIGYKWFILNMLKLH